MPIWYTYIMKCILCGEPTKKTNRYCSTRCIKRAHYLRKYPDCKSHINNNPEFWETETGIGFKWEKFIAKKLGATHLEFNKGGADLQLGDELIDVKASQPYHRKHKRGKKITGETANLWIFNRNKIKPVDWFVCVCLSGKSVVKILKIPSRAFTRTGISVGVNSKYNKYIIQ